MHRALAQRPAPKVSQSEEIARQTQAFIDSGGVIDTTPVLPVKQRIENIKRSRMITANTKKVLIKKLQAGLEQVG